MTHRLLQRFNLKPNSYERDSISIWQTNECNIIPFISVTNLMRKSNTYVRFGWLFWYLEYFKDGIPFTGDYPQDNTIGMTNNENK